MSKNNWFYIPHGSNDARYETKVSDEMIDAITYAAKTCCDKDQKLDQLNLQMQQIFGNPKLGFSRINKDNVFQRFNMLKSLLEENFLLFQKELDFKKACRTQHNISSRTNTMENIMGELTEWNIPETPSAMVKRILWMNEKRMKAEEVQVPKRITPDNLPGKSTWSDLAIRIWFEKGGYFSETKKQIAWLMWLRGKGIECEDCRASSELEIHHIDENHYNNHHTNLAVLCPTCHSKRGNK